MLIYKITNTINNKIYIGQTIQKLKTRWGQHCRNGKCSALTNAITKYGKENFTIETLEKIESIELLNDKEQYWIAYFNSLSPNGYNLTSGGENGKILSQETKEKLSKFMTGKRGEDHPGYGHKMTEDNKRKISEVNSTREFTLETRLKMSNAAKGNKKRRGKTMSEESKDKMSKSHLGKENKKIQKPIICIDKNGNILEFDSVDKAAIFLNIKRRSISNCLNGWSFSAGGYNFKYKKEI